MTQWVQLYEFSDDALDIVLHTFAAVFPQMSVWRVRDDLLLVGSAQPLSVNLDALAARFNHPAVKGDLQRINLSRLPQLLACEIISEENGAFVAPARTRVHSDFAPILEYVAQRAFFARSKPTRLTQLDERESPRPTTLLASYLKTHPLTVDDIRPFVEFYFIYSDPSARIVRSLLAHWQQLAPADPDPVHAAAQLSTPGPSVDVEVQRLAGIRDVLWKKADTDPTPLLLYHKYLWESYRSNSTAFYLPPTKELQDVITRLLQTDPQHQRVYKLELAKLAWDGGHDKPSIELALSALDRTAQGGQSVDLNPEVFREVITYMAEAAGREGQLQRALEICRSATDSRYSSPRLAMLYRKLQARQAQAVAAGSSVTGLPGDRSL
jgi:hypothetical protein